MIIQNVSDTARWVAYYRAMESERPDAVFHDPFARRLAGPEGEAIVAAMQNGMGTGQPIVARTVVFDEWVLDCVNNHGADCILNLAAGLDARAWRLSLPPSLHWIDVDLPEILSYKTDVMRNERPTCHYEAFVANMTDPVVADALLARIGASYRRVLVITEGLLIYLTPEAVATLGRALHRQASFVWWISDLASPRVLQYIQKTRGDALKNAPFRFAPANGTRFFLPLGWQEVQFRSTVDEARRLKRPMRRTWLLRLITFFSGPARRERIRRMSGYVMLARLPA